MLGVQLFSILVLLLLVSCAQVQIQDSVWCGSLGPQGAACFHMLTNQETDMTWPEVVTAWNDLSHPIAFTSSDTITNLESEIEKLCTASQDCTYAQQQTKARVLHLVRSLKGLHKP